MADFSLGNQQDDNYIDWLEKTRIAQDRMALGYHSISDKIKNNQVGDKFDYYRSAYGFGGYNPDSAFSSFEQSAVARSDRMAHMGLRVSDMVFGVGSLMSSFLPTAGAISKGFNIASFTSQIGAAASGSAGMAGVAGSLGQLSGLTNPYYLAATGALKLSQFGMQEGVLDPMVNTHMFQSSALMGMRGVLGGTQSSLGLGGMSIGESLRLGKGIEGIRRNNRDVAPGQIDNFLKASADMPQMQYVTNADQAIENMSKFTSLMVDLAKKFKGKDKEIVEAFRQFGQMGMTIDQSKRAFDQAQTMGGMLNIDPSRIMSAGATGTQMVMGTGISQSTGYSMASMNFIQAERMRQSGQLSATQLQNFGGTEGISQMTTSAHMKFLNSNLGDLFLKGMYNAGGNTSASINEDVMRKMQSGEIGLGETRYRAGQITLDPRANMQYQFDKDKIISSLGENAQGVVYQSLNKLIGNKNPYGTDVYGRAKFLQSMGMAGSKQEAMMLSQQWMGYNPGLEDYNKEMQTDAMMMSNDPYFSSQSSTVRGLNYASRNLGRGWDRLTRDVSAWDQDTRIGGYFSRGLGSTLKSITGGREFMDFYKKAVTPKDFENFRIFDGIQTGDDFSSILNEASNNTFSAQDMQMERDGKSLSYAQLENLKFDADKDKFRNVSDLLKFGLGQNGFAQDTAVEKSGIKFGQFQGKSKDEIVAEIKKRGVLSSEYSNINNQNISSDRILEGMVLEQTLSTGEKEKLQDAILRTSQVGPRLKEVKAFGLGDVAGALFQPGAGGFSLATSMLSSNVGMDSVNEFSAFFNTSDLNKKIEMSGEMKRISESGNEDYVFDERQKQMFGTRSYSEIKQMYDANKKDIDGLTSASPQEIKQMMTREKGMKVKRDISALYGGRYYSDVSAGLTGKTKTIEAIMEQFLFKDTDDKEALKMDKGAFDSLVGTFKGQAGIGDVLKAATFDEGTQTIKFKDINDKTRKRITDAVFQNSGGSFMNQIDTAEKLWEKKQGDKAVTIQDFSVAFAKGMQIYNNGAADNWSKNWNEVKSINQNPKDDK